MRKKGLGKKGDTFSKSMESSKICFGEANGKGVAGANRGRWLNVQPGDLRT